MTLQFSLLKMVEIMILTHSKNLSPILHDPAALFAQNVSSYQSIARDIHVSALF
jgi:hypothetical protein